MKELPRRKIGYSYQGKTKKKKNNMELRDFIRNTIIEIIQGVRDAQETSIIYNATVNPSYKTGHYLEIGDKIYAVKDIEFEISLTESQSEGNSKGIGVNFYSFKGGTKSGENASNTSGTKVKFSLPILFPPGER